MRIPGTRNPPAGGRWALFRAGDPLQRGQRWLLVTLAALTAGAWALTVYQSNTMDMPMGIVARGGIDSMPVSDPMAGMDDMDMASMAGMETAATSGMAGMHVDSWAWSGFTAFFIAWAVMMAAMMFPAAAPMLLIYRAVALQRRARGTAFVPTWIFASGYLLVWVAIGAVTWVAVEAGSEIAGRLSDADRERWGALALGAVLIVAGLYQLTPLKRVCLNHCRAPLAFITRHWRDGHAGAVRMGVIHGFSCLGCCWALFAVLVAAGMMSLAWMLLLTLVVFAEKVLPLGTRSAQVFGVAFLALGGVVAAGATGLPWMA